MRMALATASYAHPAAFTGAAPGLNRPSRISADESHTRRDKWHL